MTETTVRKNFQLPRGTHDILPEQVAAWRFVENTFREVCARYNYGEIRTPLFEATELFARTAGAASDILVTKQMYSFVAPDEQSYTLRPEGTAGAVRAYLEHHLNERGPVSKLFYIGPNFRYEAPQAGRYRQHHQCGVESLGAAEPESDAEVLALAHDFFAELGIAAITHLNSLGTAPSRAGYIQNLKEYLEPHRDALSEDSRKRLDLNPLRVFDSKEERDRTVVAGAPRLLDYLRENDAASMAHFERLCTHLDRLGIAYQIDPALVRGLDYYTRTAFEFVSPLLGAQSIGGGGRYDGLVEELGGAATPAIGFGIGIERLLLAREASQAQIEGVPLTAFLVTLGDPARAAGVLILHQLREAGIRCDCDFVGRSIKAQMREANRQNARFALVLGDNELAEGTVSLKDMAAGTQEVLPLPAAIAKLKLEDADAAVARYFAESD
ncbi:MAG TPA: histidine--tRNA ligase [Abditibacteriaceae bacterium]|nr:histidine--tRNA ligase [Abditibacteriaceae bacterium]